MGDNRSEALFKAVGKGDIESVKGLLNDLTQTEGYNLLKIQKEECGSTVVHCAAQGGPPNIMKYILQSVAIEYIDRLLTIQNKEGNTAIHWAAVFRRTDTMQFIMDTVPYELIYKLLTTQNVKGYTPLHRAATFGQLETMKCIVDFIAKDDPNKLRMIQCAEGNTAVHIAVERGYTEVIVCLLGTISKEDAFDLLNIRNGNGLTAVHCAAHKDGIDALKGTMKCIVDSISPDDLLNLLMIKSETGQHTVVHLVAFTETTKVMECLLDYLNPEQLGIILESRNVNDLTPLAVARKCGISKMSSCIESYLQKAAGTLQPTLQRSSKVQINPPTNRRWSYQYVVQDGQLPLTRNTTCRTCTLTMGDNRSEALFKAVGKGDIEFVKDLLDDLNQTERYNLLKIQKKKCGSTAVHLAAGKGSPDIMQYLVTSVSENYMYHLLMTKSWKGDTPVHRAAVYDCTEIMRCIMDTVPYESVYKLLIVQNVNGYTPLHRVANFGRVKTIQCIVEFLENHDLINALMIQCNTGNTAAHIAVGYGYTKILECILRPMPPKKAYNFLKIQNEECHTVVQFAADRGSTEILKNTLDCIKKCISSDDLLELLMIKCTLGQDTVVHLIAFTDEIEMMRCLLDSLTPDQRLQILNSKNVIELTPWDIANQCGNVDMMSCIERYQNEEADRLAIPRPLHTLYDNEQTVKELQHKIAGLEANLSEEITKKQLTEQQLVEATQKATDLASRNMTLENSLVEERHKREEAEKQVVEALHIEELKKMQQTPANTFNRFQSQVNTQNNKLETQRQETKKRTLENRMEKSEGQVQALLTEGEKCPKRLRETEECKNRRKQESRELSELRITVQDEIKETEDKRKLENQVMELEGQVQDDGAGSCDSATGDSSSDEDSNFWKISEEDCDLMLSQISDKLSKLCSKHSVKYTQLSCDSKDEKKLLIFGMNAEKIPQQKIDELLEGTGFSATTQSSDSLLHTEMLSDPILKVTKKEWTSKQWIDYGSSACEVLLDAFNRNMEKPDQEKLGYLAGPAHMVLDEEQREAYAAVDMTKQAREEVEKKTTNSRYIIELQGREDEDPVDMGHPPLLCYRYRCSCRIEPGSDSVCRSCVKFDSRLKKSEKGNITYKNLSGAFHRGHLDDIPICQHMILNDMMFLTLDLQRAQELNRTFRKSLKFRIGSMFKVTHVKQLRDMSRNKSPIVVGKYDGKLTRMPIDLGESKGPPYTFLGFHLAFTLTEDDQGVTPVLKLGDCGHIVFHKESDTECKPIGVFIGRVKNQLEVYQAVLLHQAILEMEHDYSHHLSNVTLLKDDQVAAEAGVDIPGGEVGLNIGGAGAALDI